MWHAAVPISEVPEIITTLSGKKYCTGTQQLLLDSDHGLSNLNVMWYYLGGCNAKQIETLIIIKFF